MSSSTKVPNPETHANLENLVKNLKTSEEGKKQTSSSGAPVHLWNPEFCGKLDLTIEEDGTWTYNKTPIGRQKLVKLFASVIKREEGEYYLVTPVEKMLIEVKDVPFIITDMEIKQDADTQVISMVTNVGDRVEASAENPLRFQIQDNQETLKPYIKIRHEGENMLEARLSRPVYYELANNIETETIDGEEFLGVWSHGTFFKIEKAENCQ